MQVEPIQTDRGQRFVRDWCGHRPEARQLAAGVSSSQMAPVTCAEQLSAKANPTQTALQIQAPIRARGVLTYFNARSAQFSMLVAEAGAALAGGVFEPRLDWKLRRNLNYRVSQWVHRLTFCRMLLAAPYVVSVQSSPDFAGFPLTDWTPTNLK